MKGSASQVRRVSNRGSSRGRARGISASGIVGLVLCIVFVPVILVNAALIAGSFLHPDELPGVFGVKPAVVLSGSMEPTIQTGDLIAVTDCDPTALHEGDVVCYLSSGKAITHRIASVTTGEDGQLRYVTQGDANNAADRLPVTVDQVQGVWSGMRLPGRATPSCSCRRLRAWCCSSCARWRCSSHGTCGVDAAWTRPKRRAPPNWSGSWPLFGRSRPSGEGASTSPDGVCIGSPFCGHSAGGRTL